MSSSSPASAARGALDVDIVVRPIAGERESGDHCTVIPWPRGVVLAMADGLGHGPLAASASRAFVECVSDAASLRVEEIFERAHRTLLKTRGAVGAIARFDHAQCSVEVAGIGNIAVSLHRQGSRPLRPVLIAGVLGSTYRTVRAETLKMEIGDLLVMHSDGLGSRWNPDFLWTLPAHGGAQMLVNAHSKGTDDVACSIARLVAFPDAGKMPGGAREAAELSRTIPVRMPGDPECVAHEARELARRAGFDPRAGWEVSIAASELATNVLKYSGSGEVRLLLRTTPEQAIVVEAVDRGAPPRASGVLQPGLGEGLKAVRRLMDSVEIDVREGKGMRVVARKLRKEA